MFRIAFTPVIITVVAAILSLSAFANAYAAGDTLDKAEDARSGHGAKAANGGDDNSGKSGDNNVDDHQPQQVSKLPDYSKCPSGSSCAVRAPDNGPHDDNNIIGSIGDIPNRKDVERKALEIARCSAE